MKTNDRYRPKFHYTCKEGWINDPNGFSMYQGEYHIFAQHNPYDTKWGPMHWAHGVSKDLITWEHRAIALTPEKEYEKELGCFSGTGMEYDGKHILMYTGGKGILGKNMCQQQCIAIGDGYQYEKLEENPVITIDQTPDYVPETDFRDPKIFRHEGKFYSLIGAMVGEKKIGCLLLYRSSDLLHWEFVGETLRAPEDGSFGIVYECPDIFPLGDKYVILCSPVDMPSQGEKYNNLSSTVYFVGDMDFTTGAFTEEYVDEIDMGFDFYAPQTLEDKDGSRIMIAWAQMWERNMVTDQLDHGWAGAMSLPRTLELNDNRLYQTPVKSLSSYEGKCYSTVEEGSHDSYHMVITIDLSEGSKFELSLLKHTCGSFDIFYDRGNHSLVIDRSKSLYRLDRHVAESEVYNRRSVKLESKEKLTLEIIVDRSMIEIFINGGRHTMTSNYYVGKGEISTLLCSDFSVEVRKVELV